MDNNFLSHEKEMFKKTGNPIWAWEAILEMCNYHSVYSPEAPECSRMDPPIFPDWIIRYLEQTALKLLSIDSPGDKARDKIKQALGFANASVFSKRKRDTSDLRFDILVEVYKERKKRRWGEKGDDIFQSVAERINKKYNIALAATTIKKLYNDYNKLINMISRS